MIEKVKEKKTKEESERKKRKKKKSRRSAGMQVRHNERRDFSFLCRKV